MCVTNYVVLISKNPVRNNNLWWSCHVQVCCVLGQTLASTFSAGGSGGIGIGLLTSGDNALAVSGDDLTME